MQQEKELEIDRWLGSLRKRGGHPWRIYHLFRCGIWRKRPRIKENLQLSRSSTSQQTSALLGWRWEYGVTFWSEERKHSNLLLHYLTGDPFWRYGPQQSHWLPKFKRIHPTYGSVFPRLRFLKSKGASFWGTSKNRGQITRGRCRPQLLKRDHLNDAAPLDSLQWRFANVPSFDSKRSQCVHVQFQRTIADWCGRIHTPIQRYWHLFGGILCAKWRIACPNANPYWFQANLAASLRAELPRLDATRGWLGSWVVNAD